MSRSHLGVLSRFLPRSACRPAALLLALLALVLLAAAPAPALVQRLSTPDTKSSGSEISKISALVTSPDGLFRFDDERFFPPRNGNTVHAAQSISAVIEPVDQIVLDEEATVLEVLPENGGPLSKPSIAVTAQDGGSFLIQSETVPLNMNTRYTARLLLHSVSGQVETLEWKFRRMDFQVRPAEAAIDEAIGYWREQTDEWVFLPQVRVGGFTVSTSQTEHSGWGPVGQQVPLGSAEVVYELNGSTEVVRPFPHHHEVTVYKPYGKALGESSTTAAMYGRAVWLPPVVLDLPADARNPVLRMQAVPTEPYVPAEYCADPQSGTVGCTTDPLRFFLPEDFAQTLLDLPEALDLKGKRAAMQRTRTDQQPALGELPIYITELIDPPLAELIEPGFTPYWRPFTLDTALFSTGLWNNPDHWVEYWLWVLMENWQGWQCIEDPASCPVLPNYVEGVGYQSTIVPEAPSLFPAFCAAGYPCTSAQANSMETEQLRRDCLQINGIETRHPDKVCRQFNVIHHMHAAEPVSTGSPAKFDFQVVVRSQIGYMNLMNTSQPYDQLGISWHDRASWQVRRDPYDNFKLARYDVYYCDGREVDQNYADREYLFVSDQVSGYNLHVSVSPYGVAHPDAAQWKFSGDINMPSEYTMCMYFFPYPGAGVRYNQPAYARMTTMMVSAWASTYDTQFAGTTVASVGHVWRYYWFQWKPTFRAYRGIYDTVTSLFAFEPYENDKSAEIHWDIYHEHGYN